WWSMIFSRKVAPTFRDHALIRALLERLAERVRRINPEDLHLLRVEGELLEGEYEVAVLGVAFDIGVELGREEIALNHVAFELGHVDAVGGKSAERLVERGRHVAHPEQERGDDRALVVRRPFGVAREYDEPRGVVVLVLDVLSEHVEPVNF